MEGTQGGASNSQRSHFSSAKLRKGWEQIRGSGGIMGTNGIGYARALGERLRRIRVQKGMSLHDVQQASEGKWKAAVVGAYERGDRNITVARLSDLADFYGVPVPEILPEDPDGMKAPETRRRVVLNLTGMDRIPEAHRDAMHRFATAIQIQRGDFNGRVLTIREDDLMALSIVYGTSPSELSQRLADWGLLVD